MRPHNDVMRSHKKRQRGGAPMLLMLILLIAALVIGVMSMRGSQSDLRTAGAEGSQQVRGFGRNV